MNYRFFMKLSTALILQSLIVFQNWVIAWEGSRTFHNQIREVDILLYDRKETDR